jgi:hypothetical protein
MPMITPHLWFEGSKSCLVRAGRVRGRITRRATRSATGKNI